MPRILAWLRTLAWVLGLGIPATMLFGEHAGALAGAIGFLIGSTSRPRTPRDSSMQNVTAPTSEADRSQETLGATVDVEPATSPWPIAQSGVPSDPASPAVATSEPVAAGSYGASAGLLSFLKWGVIACGVSAVGVIVVMVLGAYHGKEETFPDSPFPARPTLDMAPAWSRDRCIREHFPASIVTGMQIPPEVNLFCAYPWKTERLTAVLEAITSQGVSPARILDGYKTQSDELKLARKIAALIERSKDTTGVMAVFQLAHVMPFLWVSKFGSPEDRKSMRETLIPEAIGRLKAAAAEVPWNEPMTRDLHHEISLAVVSDIQATLFTDRISSPIWTEFGGYMRIFLGLNQSLKQKIEGLPEGLRPSAELTAGWAALGYSPRDSIMLGGLSSYIELLQARSIMLFEHPDHDQAHWRPKWRPQDPTRPFLEVFYQDHAPEPWCGGVEGVDTEGQYCSSENRLFASTRQISRSELYPGLVSADLGLSAALFHELGHAYLNPSIDFDAPFVTEGLVTAEGEETLRSLNAGARVALAKLSSGTFYEWSRSLLRSDDTAAGAAGSIGGDAAVRFAFTETGKTSFTRFQEAALCLLHSQPMNLAFIETQITLSNSSFRTQPAPASQRAYAAAWAIFHFGRGLRGNKGAVDQEFNTGSIFRAADKQVQNEELTLSELSAVSDLITKVQGAVERSIKAKRLRCRAVQ